MNPMMLPKPQISLSFVDVLCLLIIAKWLFEGRTPFWVQVVIVSLWFLRLTIELIGMIALHAAQKRRENDPSVPAD